MNAQKLDKQTYRQTGRQDDSFLCFDCIVKKILENIKDASYIEDVRRKKLSNMNNMPNKVLLTL